MIALFLRAFLFLAIVGSMVYKSGVITPIIEGQGDVLRKTVVENLTQSLQYINQIEELRVTRNVRTEAERLSWYERKGAADQLHVQLNNIAYRQMEDIKELLERYDRVYLDSKTPFYRGQYLTNVYSDVLINKYNNSFEERKQDSNE